MGGVNQFGVMRVDMFFLGGGGEYAFWGREGGGLG